MKVLVGFEELVHNITFVDILEKRAFFNHSVQVRVWGKKIKIKEENCQHIATAAVSISA